MLTLGIHRAILTVLFMLLEGPLAVIGPNHLITDDPEVILRMNAARSQYGRSDWYKSQRVDPFHENMFSHRDLLKHDSLRRKVASGYSGRDNPDLEKCVDERIVELINKMRDGYLSDDTVLRALDFGKLSQYFTLDVLTQIGFGSAFGFLSQEKDLYAYQATIAKILPMMTLMGALPPLTYLMHSPWIHAFTGPTYEDKEGVGKLMSFARKEVAGRFGPQKITRADMLGSFIQRGISQRDAESEVMFQILAGSDSTATAIRAIFLYVVTTPLVYTKLQAEIDRATSSGEVTSSPILLAEAKQLPYLQACIREGLRIFPPVTGLLSKVVPKNGDEICGKFVPGGTKIAYCSWGLQRNKVYGDDVDLFRPERWLEADDEQLDSMKKVQELVFGHGRFSCLGMPIALLELNKVMFELFRWFDFSILNPTCPWKSANYGLFVQSDMQIRLTDRRIDTSV